MYLTAPVNRFFNPSIKVSYGESEVEMEVKSDFYHAAGALHGSILFKMLDDSAYFAVNSIVSEVCVLTASMNVYFLRPVKDGILKAKGRVIQPSRRLFLAESEVRNANGRVVAKGSGHFAKSKIPLRNCPGYGEKQGLCAPATCAGKPQGLNFP